MQTTELKKGHGYTTGSCATAGVKAALTGLLTGVIPAYVNIITPSRVKLTIEILNGKVEGGSASCAVRKFSGDDPDITNGTLICSKVTKITEKGIKIEGGVGVGRVTLKGLSTPVGRPAINPTPLKTITEEVEKLMLEHEVDGIEVEISVPEGEALAKKTYNSRLGIVGGISIIGTSGIVEPMSSKALIDTFEAEMRVLKAGGARDIIITPGNYGMTYIGKASEIDDKFAVKCSNFIGDAIDLAREKEFETVLLIGHIGKFIKLSGGVFNTHSNNADVRAELIAAAAIRANASNEALNEILDCIVTEDAVDVLHKYGIFEKTMEVILEKIGYYVGKRFENGKIGVMIYSNRHGLLTLDKNAEQILEKWSGK